MIRVSKSGSSAVSCVVGNSSNLFLGVPFILWVLCTSGIAVNMLDSEVWGHEFDIHRLIPYCTGEIWLLRGSGYRI